VATILVIIFLSFFLPFLPEGVVITFCNFACSPISEKNKDWKYWETTITQEYDVLGIATQVGYQSIEQCKGKSRHDYSLQSSV
jgi:hypothetical protein